MKDYTIKDVTNLFILKKEIDDNTIKNIRNPFRLKKGNEAIKDWIVGYIKSIFELEVKVMLIEIKSY